MKDFRIIYFLIARLVLSFLLSGMFAPQSSEGVVWLLFILFFFIVSSGWIYFIAFRIMSNKKLLGISLSITAFAIDVIFSWNMFDGMKDWLPHFGYAASGFVLFWIVYFITGQKIEK